MSINVLFQPSFSARDEYMELHKFYSQWAGGCWVQLCIQGFILASWSLKLGIQLTLGSKTDSLEQIVNTNPPWARAKEMGEERRCVCRCNLKWDYSCEWKRQHTGRQSVLGCLAKKKKSSQVHKRVAVCQIRLLATLPARACVVFSLTEEVLPVTSAYTSQLAAFPEVIAELTCG